VPLGERGYRDFSLIVKGVCGFPPNLLIRMSSFSMRFNAGFRMWLTDPSDVVIVRRFSMSDLLMVCEIRIVGRRTVAKTATPMSRFIQLLKLSCDRRV